MKKIFIDAKTKNQARKICPWACKIVKAEGGYWCFESADDWHIWKAQK